MKHAIAITALALTAALTAPQAHAGPTLDPIFTFENPQPGAVDLLKKNAPINPV